MRQSTDELKYAASWSQSTDERRPYHLFPFAVVSSTQHLKGMIRSGDAVAADSPFLLIFSRGQHSSMEARKAEVRQRFDRYRRSLDEETYEKLSHLAVKQLVRLPEIQKANVVHVYWPMLERREVDTRSFIHWLKSHDKEIVLPVVLNFQRSGDTGQRLDHVRYPGEEGLRLNRWGIAEPADHHAVPLEQLDVVVVPAFGADRDGYRIGHGYGYYDEFLAEISVPTVALVYSECLVDHVPTEDHDRRVDIIVTERTVVRPVRSGPAM